MSQSPYSTREFDKRMVEFAQWYNYNRNHGMDPNKFVEFGTRAIDLLAEMVVILGSEVMAMQRRGVDPNVRRILTPTGVNLKAGPMHR